MPQVKIVAKNFMDMVASLPNTKLDRLFQSGLICEAILGSLPSLAKNYVMHLLYLNVPVPGKSLENWVLASEVSKHKAAINKLTQLRVLHESFNMNREVNYSLNPTFQSNIQNIIKQPLTCSGFRLPSAEDLDAYSAHQRECFLLHLVSFSGGSSMMKMLRRHLLSQRDERDSPRLTEGGFQFLLMDTNAQLWYIIREYISSSDDSADVISFLLELSFHTAGEAYSMNTLNNAQKTIINDLADLGLVRLQKGTKESWFIPTTLAASIVSVDVAPANKLGYIVVETNFKVYAYTTSKLQCEILGLFAKVECQLPNLTVGEMTRESLCKAFENGITADQVISFLQLNAHPRAAERVPCVPETVTDQIRLWESNLNSVQATHAHILDEFPSKDKFESASDFARECGGFLWEDRKQKCLVVSAECFPQMKEFLRRKKQ